MQRFLLKSVSISLVSVSGCWTSPSQVPQRRTTSSDQIIVAFVVFAVAAARIDNDDDYVELIMLVRLAKPNVQNTLPSRKCYKVIHSVSQYWQV